MDIVLEQYRSRLQNVKRSAPSTLLAFDYAARRFQHHLDALGKTAAQMEAWDLEDYLAGLDLADNTKATMWIHIGAALRYAHRRGMFAQDPTADVFLAKRKEGVPKTIPNAELRKMRQRIHSDRHWLVFHLLAYTGMRQGEIRALQWPSVDLAASQLRLDDTKNGSTRYVPVHPTLGEILHDLCREEGYVVTTRGDRPLAYNTWIDDLRRFAPGFTAHWFRRTVTSSLLDNDVEWNVVQQILGHKPQTVMGRFYAKPNLRIIQRAILKLYADDPI